MSNERYGQWTVIREVKNFNRRQWYEFQCDCGTKKIFAIYLLLHGKKIECPGCKKKEINPEGGV